MKVKIKTVSEKEKLTGFVTTKHSPKNANGSLIEQRKMILDKSLVIRKKS
jgi:hypothetical protein